MQFHRNIYLAHYATVVISFFVRHDEKMRAAIAISLSRTERRILRRWASGVNGRLAQRASIVLLAAAGLQNKQIAAELGTDEQTVSRWRSRFSSKRNAGIENEANRSGRKRLARERLAGKILRMARHRTNRLGPLSIRSLAKTLGVNHMLVYRVLRENGRVTERT